MVTEIISLPVNYRGKLDNHEYTPTLTTYILDNYPTLDLTRKRPLVIVCPGGGYTHLSVREAEPIAIRMNSLGFHAAVLTYSLAPMDFPAAFCDAAEAVHYVRSHAQEWNVDPDKIIVCGFSAGAHVAAGLGCYWNGRAADDTLGGKSAPDASFNTQAPLLPQFIPYSAEEIKPNALVLGYPVITAGEFCHDGSIKNVLGKKNKAHRSWVSLETKVSPDVPPVFMWHTDADETVVPENSLLFAGSLKRANIPFEYHLFARGVHGLALATAETCVPEGPTIEPECAVWPELLYNWLNGMWKIL